MSWGLWGHEWAETLLKRHAAQGTTRHAYLFTGPSGSGRRALALCFAKALSCKDPPAPGEFCGHCVACKQIDREQYPDLVVGASEAEGSILKIDTIRTIQHGLNMKPYMSPYRLALLLRFEEANTSAQNALLKTLEEPPEASKLLLTASNENALLPTIASRCEVIRLRPMEQKAFTERLIQEKGLAPEDSLRIAALSSGRVGFALRLVEEPDEVTRLISIAQEGLELLGQTTVQRFAYATSFKESKTRGALRETLMIWQTLFRDLLLLSFPEHSGEPELSFIDLREQMTDLASKQSGRSFREMLSEINQSLIYLNANVNTQLLIENLLLGWPLIR